MPNQIIGDQDEMDFSIAEESAESESFSFLDESYNSKKQASSKLAAAPPKKSLFANSNKVASQPKVRAEDSASDNSMEFSVSEQELSQSADMGKYDYTTSAFPPRKSAF